MDRFLYLLFALSFWIFYSKPAETQNTYDVRLVGGSLAREGRVEIYYGSWGTVCDDGWGISDARVVCRQLGYPSSLALFYDDAHFGEGSGNIWLDDTVCSGSESRLVSCSHSGWGIHNCYHSEDAGVRCYPSPIRIVGGSSSMEGRVEIEHSTGWGTVCDDEWDEYNAEVVCRELGYPNSAGYTALARTGAYFGEGGGQVLMDNVNCGGSESHLVDCSFSGWKIHNCGHDEDAGVVCRADIDECGSGTHTCAAQATCSNTVGSFTCTCNTGYTGSGQTCTDINECAIGSHTCAAQATCSNTVGSYTCACNTGYNGDGQTCADIDECAGSPNCDTNANCVNTIGSYTCSCSSGFRGDGETCTDVDECTLGTDNCDANAECSNTVGAFTCTCNIGYTWSQQSCIDADECTAGTANCHDTGAACTNTVGSFTCACNAGYEGDGITCNDEDECTLSTDNCDANSECSNTVGSFTCTCNAGYTWTVQMCSDADECTADTDDCHDTGATCTNTVGSFTCACNAGYEGDGIACNDLDECTLGTDNCDANAVCGNTLGSYTCTCNNGYTGTGQACSDADECTADTDDCHDTGATCTNTVGSFTCACNAGYEGDGITCNDVDECTLGSDDCDAIATCGNTVGSFTCTCNTGYTGSGQTCSDADECSADTDNCHDTGAACTNTVGSFTCACNAGYEGDGITCDDLDECTLNTFTCPSQSTCSNTIGSYDCICLTGYEYSEGDCVDIDECSRDTHNCHAEATCTNNEASFTCECNNGYTGDGLTCNDVDECSDNTHTCNPLLATCSNIAGSFECECDLGYEGDGFTCTDRDECTLNLHDCHSNGVCANNVGSFDCSCDVGYTGDGRQCTDIDECADATDDCHAEASCSNTDGSFDCTCNRGYQGSGTSCTDIDECIANTHNCHNLGVCTNNVGSFDCACGAGYQGDGIDQCNDIDECATGDHTCHYNGTCTNTIGSYTCTCNTGYHGDGYQCNDIDECAQDTDDCHSHATCYNVDGSFYCVCNDGFKGNGHDTCLDIDECVLDIHSCHFNATCNNTFGDYDCDCNAGYGGDGFKCELLSVDCQMYDSVESPESDSLEEYLRILECRPDLAGEGDVAEAVVEVVVEKVTEAITSALDVSFFPSSGGTGGVTGRIGGDNGGTNGGTGGHTSGEGGGGAPRPDPEPLPVEDLLQKAADTLESITADMSLTKPLEISTPAMDAKVERKTAEVLKKKGWDHGTKDFISIAAGVFEKIETEKEGVNTTCNIMGISYKGIAASMSNQTSNFSGYESYVASDVLTTSVICNKEKLSVPSSFKKTLINSTLGLEEGETLEPVCVWWNASDDGGSWSDFGCEINSTDDDTVTCYCNHTTNYAVLMQIKPPPGAKDHGPILSAITSYGCTASIIFLGVGQLLSCLFQHSSLSAERVMIHRHLMGSLLVAMCLFLLSSHFGEMYEACKAFAVALHLAYTCVFAWMLVEAIHLYRLLVVVYGSEKDLKKVYYAVGYGMPLLIVAVSVGIGHRYYGLNKLCWLSVNNGFIWAFVGPALAIIFANTVVLLIVVKTSVRASKLNDGTKLENIKVGVRSAFMLFPMLGITWIFGLLSSFHIAFSYMFTFMNSFQVRTSLVAEYKRMTAKLHNEGSMSERTKTKFNSIAPMKEDTEEQTTQSRMTSPIQTETVVY